MGFDDKNAGVVWQTIKTIKHMVPVMFVMENVVDIVCSRDGVDDLTVIKTFMEEELGDTFNTVTRSIHWMLLVMPLSVDLTSAGNNTPESKLGIVCTPSWTLNTKKLEETNEPHFIAACNSLVPIFS